MRRSTCEGGGRSLQAVVQVQEKISLPARQIMKHGVTRDG